MRNIYALIFTIALGGTLLTGCNKADEGKVAAETTSVTADSGAANPTETTTGGNGDGTTGSSVVKSTKTTPGPKSTTPVKTTNPDGTPATTLRSANANSKINEPPESNPPAKSFEVKDVVGKWRVTDNDGLNHFGVLELNADGSFSMTDKLRGLKSSSGIWKVGVDQVAIVMSIVNGKRIGNGERLQVTIAPDGKSMYGDKRRFERMAK